MVGLQVTDVRFSAADAASCRTGLLGYVSCTVGDALRLDGITLRRTAGGELALSYPARTARDGRRHPYVRPLHEPARLAMEAAVLQALSRPA